MEQSPRESPRQTDVRFKLQREALPEMRQASTIEKPGNRVTYKDLQVPRLVKRTSNLSVEPQFGSESDCRPKKQRATAQASKHDAGNFFSK